MEPQCCLMGNVAYRGWAGVLFGEGSEGEGSRRGRMRRGESQTTPDDPSVIIGLVGRRRIAMNHALESRARGRALTGLCVCCREEGQCDAVATTVQMERPPATAAALYPAAPAAGGARGRRGNLQRLALDHHEQHDTQRHPELVDRLFTLQRHAQVHLVTGTYDAGAFVVWHTTAPLMVKTSVLIRHGAFVRVVTSGARRHAVGLSPD